MLLAPTFMSQHVLKTTVKATPKELLQLNSQGRPQLRPNKSCGEILTYIMHNRAIIQPLMLQNSNSDL
eukprot:335080-Amphidinium_carterae.1